MYLIADFFVCRCNAGLNSAKSTGFGWKKYKSKNAVCHSPNLLWGQTCAFKIEFTVQLHNSNLQWLFDPIYVYAKYFTGIANSSMYIFNTYTFPN